MTRSIMLSMFASFFSFFARAQSDDVSKLPPINELGTGEFMGHQGGLYPGGSNQMPAAFYTDAVAMASSVQPLDKSGNPDPNGKIGLIGLGASTVAMFSNGLTSMVPGTSGLNKEIVYVNCGIGGQDFSDILNPAAKFWPTIDQRLATAGITVDQVQVLWCQEDNLKNSSNSIDQRGQSLVDDFTELIRMSKQHYPNLKLFYMTGRHTTAFMPADAKDKHREPKSYINGWACKWVIEKQINGDATLSYKGDNAKAPLVLWGPYFWTQGSTPRKDGYTWTKDLVSNDGVHPSEAGITRVSQDLIDFWSTDPVSQIWFLESGAGITGTSTTTTETTSDYMRLIVNTTPVKKIPFSEISEEFKIGVGKDSTVVYKNDHAKRDTVFIITLKEPGNYTIKLTGADGELHGGKFTIDENMVVTADDKSDVVTDPNAPAWIVNGVNKMSKLKRLMAPHTTVKAVFYDSKGKMITEVEDVLNKHTDLNEILDRGMYPVKFFDEKGEEIPFMDSSKGYVKIKY